MNIYRRASISGPAPVAFCDSPLVASDLSLVQANMGSAQMQDMSFHIQVDGESLCISLREQGRASPVKVLRRSHREVVVTRWGRRWSQPAVRELADEVVVTWLVRKRSPPRRACDCRCGEEKENGCQFEHNPSAADGKKDFPDKWTGAGQVRTVFEKLICIFKKSCPRVSSTKHQTLNTSFKQKHVLAAHGSDKDKETKVIFMSETGIDGGRKAGFTPNFYNHKLTRITLCSDKGDKGVLPSILRDSSGTEILLTSDSRESPSNAAELTSVFDSDKENKDVFSAKNCKEERPEPEMTTTTNSPRPVTLMAGGERNMAEKQSSREHPGQSTEARPVETGSFRRDATDAGMSLTTKTSDAADEMCVRQVESTGGRERREKGCSSPDRTSAPDLSTPEESLGGAADNDIDVRVPDEARLECRMPTRDGHVTSSLLYDVYIAHCQEDVQLAQHLLQELEGRGFTCFVCERDFPVGHVISEVICDAVRSSRHVVPVLSKRFLDKDWSTYKLHTSLSWMYETNRVLLLPVLVDISETDVPWWMRHISSVNMSTETDYVGKLVSILQGPEVKVHEVLPVGNLSYGIVFNYYLGYLRFVLPGIQQRIDAWCQQNANTTCVDLRMSRKFYILVPVSCYCPQTLAVDRGRAVSFCGHLPDVILSRAASVQRVYRHTVWNIFTSSGQVLQFVGEYPSCLNTLYEMEMARNAGLDSHQRQQQRQEFLHTLKVLLDSNGHSESVQIVDYPDKDSSGNIVPLSQILTPIIEGDRLPASLTGPVVK